MSESVLADAPQSEADEKINVASAATSISEPSDLNKEYEAIRRADLSAIKNEYPSLDVTKVEELGDDFIKLRRSGIDAVSAYRAVRREAPVSTGSTEGSGIEKSPFYTAEDVMAMSRNEIRKNFEKIERSMKNW